MSRYLLAASFATLAAIAFTFYPRSEPVRHDVDLRDVESLEVDLLEAGQREDTVPQRARTFCRDIAPIVFARCSGCHRPGESAPFSLLEYRDVAKRQTQILDVIQRRIMPPWLPEPGHGEFVDDPSVSPREIARFREWVEQGAPRGDLSELPATPTWESGWRLGEPDLVLTMSEPYELSADGTDVYRSFVLPLPIRSTKYVRTFEFRPGNPRVVHHANMSTDRTHASRDRDLADADYGFDGMALEATGLDSIFNGWAPGIRPDPGYDDIAARVDPGDDFVIQLHMTPSGKPEHVQAQVGLYFADQPPTRRPSLVRLGSYAIHIPAGASRYQVHDEYKLPIDVDVLGISPHAHYLARTITATAVTPEGRRISLLRINNWNFNWQGSYRYSQPVHLQRGSRIAVRFGFDNSADNPQNPSHPPRTVLYGPRTADEMADLWLLLLPRDATDSPKLRRDVALCELSRRIDGYANLILHHPDKTQRASAHDGLGTIFLAKGLRNDAVEHFEKALQLDEDCVAAHFHLGSLRGQSQQYDRAVSHLERVLQANPAHPASHCSLGQIAEAQGQTANTIRHYRTALEFDPELSIARARLGHLLALQGDRAEAAEHLRKAEFPRD